jgi:hypothetical protein
MDSYSHPMESMGDDATDELERTTSSKEKIATAFP